MPHVTLAATPLPAADLPGEFRLFRAGLNQTSKGPFLFDAEAARSVLAAQGRDGVDLMIDLEHLSLDAGASSYDPDARAWCRLEVRGGDLWACNVRWTPDGAARLHNKTQRYISPVVERDPKTYRVLSVHNLALVGMPATHGAQPLVAASKLGLTRSGSTVLRTRVTKDSAVVFCALAKRRGTTPGALVRKMLVALASSPYDDADKSLDLIREMLSLEGDAGRAEIVAALDQLFGLVGDGSAESNDPLASTPDPKPADPFKLSAAQVRALAKARLPLTRSGWTELKRRVVRRA